MNLASKIVISFGSFEVSLANPWTWAGIVFILIVLWRWWGIKRLILFSIIISVLMVFMFRLDNIICNRLGAEEGNPFALLIKPFFLSLSAVIFLCFGFINRN
ncbi:hypothetical protein ACFL2Y_00190 [Candidatus Omnitrophota bacterium]